MISAFLCPLGCKARVSAYLAVHGRELPRRADDEVAVEDLGALAVGGSGGGGGISGRIGGGISGRGRGFMEAAAAEP